MPICSNCGAELDASAKFCMECGTPVPQIRKCIQCGMELPLKAKFCLGCGAPQEGAAASGVGAGINMGDKNVVAGDVIGQKIAGDNVATKVMGNAIYNTIQDDTKRVNTCCVCGKHMTNDEGHTCPKCGKYVCPTHFNFDKNVCQHCVQNIFDIYSNTLKQRWPNGKIKCNEKDLLKQLRAKAELSPAECAEIEKSYLLGDQIIVSASGDGDFSTITEALDYADNGSTIILKNGTYREHFTIEKNICIIGEVKGKTVPVIGDVLENTDVCINVNAKATLKNLKVVSFDENVDYDSLDSENGRYYAAINITDDAVLENICVDGWFDDGIRICGESVNPSIRNSKFTNNQGAGLNIQGGARGAIENCVIFGKGLFGIYVAESETNPTITNCNIHDSEGNGIYICDEANGIIENCDIFGFKRPAIVIEGANTDPTISNCKIHNNKSYGVWIKDGAQGSVEKCEIFKNGTDQLDSGIFIDGSETAPSISNCKIHDNNEYGLFIGNDASGKISNCTTNSHSSFGLYIEDGATPEIVNFGAPDGSCIWNALTEWPQKINWSPF